MNINGYDIKPYANLVGADLGGAKRGEFTINKFIAQITGLRWPVIIFDSHIEIGCQSHTVQTWEEFNKSEISQMSSCAPEFLAKYKKHILGIANQGDGV